MASAGEKALCFGFLSDLTHPEDCVAVWLSASDQQKVIVRWLTCKAMPNNHLTSVICRQTWQIPRLFGRSQRLPSVMHRRPRASTVNFAPRQPHVFVTHVHARCKHKAIVNATPRLSASYQKALCYRSIEVSSRLPQDSDRGIDSERQRGMIPNLTSGRSVSKLSPTF